MHGDFSIDKVEAINMQISILALQSLIALYIMQIPRMKNMTYAITQLYILYLKNAGRLLRSVPVFFVLQVYILLMLLLCV